MIGSATVFRHLRNKGPGTLGNVMRDAGVSVQIIDTPREDLRDFDPLKPELLVVMGGPVGVYDAPDYPFLTQEINILEKRIAVDKPTLGICLGSQLMASALGAKVYIGRQGKEYGWHALSLSKAGEVSPVQHLGAAHTSMFHCHGDTFDLPDGAVLLASTEKYQNQIYSFGKSVLGVQCHPEITPEQFPEWLVMFVGTVTGPNAVADIDKMRADNAKFATIMQEQTRKFLLEWLGKIDNA